MGDLGFITIKWNDAAPSGSDNLFETDYNLDSSQQDSIGESSVSSWGDTAVGDQSIASTDAGFGDGFANAGSAVGESNSNWRDVTPMTGTHIPGVDTGAKNGQTTFMDRSGQLETISSGDGSYVGGAVSNSYGNMSEAPHPTYLKLAAQLNSNATATPTAQQVLDARNGTPGESYPANGFSPFDRSSPLLASSDGYSSYTGVFGLPGMILPFFSTDTSWDTQSNFTVSEQGIDLLKSVEQLRLQPYDDQTGRDTATWVTGATIGYGHLINKNEWELYKNGITAEQAEQILQGDLAPAVDGVNRLLQKNVTQNQFDALALLAFNIGTGDKGLGASSVLKMVNDPTAVTSYPSLQSAWMAWNKTQGKVSQGVTNRRGAEWNIYSKSVYSGW